MSQQKVIWNDSCETTEPNYHITACGATVIGLGRENGWKNFKTFVFENAVLNC